MSQLQKWFCKWAVKCCSSLLYIVLYSSDLIVLPALHYCSKSSAEQWSHGFNWHASWSIRSFSYCWQARDSSPCSCRFAFPGLLSSKCFYIVYERLSTLIENILSFFFTLLARYLMLYCNLFSYKLILISRSFFLSIMLLIIPKNNSVWIMMSVREKTFCCLLDYSLKAVLAVVVNHIGS